jgi:hypothetical protein
MSRTERKKNLHENFFFECHCSACTFSTHSVSILKHFIFNNNNNNNNISPLVLNHNEITNDSVSQPVTQTASEEENELLWDIFMKKEDQYRSKTAQLDSLILEVAKEDSNLALDMALELLKILLLERNQLWSVRYIADAYLYVYHISLSLDRRKQAYGALKEAHNWNLRLQGNSTPDYKRTLELLHTFGNT